MFIFCNIVETPDTEEHIILMPPDDSEAPDGANSPGTDQPLLCVKAATLNKLIERLTAENNFDSKFQKTFITTYR